MLAAGERGKRIEALLWAMDRANVSDALVSGMPFIKKWSEDEPVRPSYYLDATSRVVRARDTDYHLALAVEDFARQGGEPAVEQLRRLHPCVSGFDGTDLGAVDMIVKRLQEFPGVFKCIGEVMSRHDDLTNLTTGERPRANHPALLRIFDFAGEQGIPVSVHHNIAPVSADGAPRAPIYLTELLEAFEAAPETTFIWCHAGVSRRIRINNLPRASGSGARRARASHLYRSLLGGGSGVRAEGPCALGRVDPPSTRITSSWAPMRWVASVITPSRSAFTIFCSRRLQTLS